MSKTFNDQSANESAGFALVGIQKREKKNKMNYIFFNKNFISVT